MTAITVEKDTGEITHDTTGYLYNPAHRWYYYRDMTPEEVLVFKAHDTDRSRSISGTPQLPSPTQRARQGVHDEGKRGNPRPRPLRLTRPELPSPADRKVHHHVATDSGLRRASAPRRSPTSKTLIPPTSQTILRRLSIA